MLVDALSERPADALHLGDVVDRRRLHAAQPTERREQRLAALVADPGDLAQHGRGARFAPARAVPDDREAMRFIADLLDEMQARMRWRELQGFRLRLDDQLLHAGLALRTLRDTDYADLVQPKVVQHRRCDAHLPFPTVDEDQV